jgi:hypothetical protein
VFITQLNATLAQPVLQGQDERGRADRARRSGGHGGGPDGLGEHDHQVSPI